MGRTGLAATVGAVNPTEVVRATVAGVRVVKVDGVTVGWVRGAAGVVTAKSSVSIAMAAAKAAGSSILWSMRRSAVPPTSPRSRSRVDRSRATEPTSWRRYRHTGVRN